MGAGSGLRRVAHWRNRRFGWGQRHIWLFLDRSGMWWLYARVGDGENPRQRWRHAYATEEEARLVARQMRARTEAEGDTWSLFNPE